MDTSRFDTKIVIDDDDAPGEEPVPYLYDSEEAAALKAKAEAIRNQQDRITELENALDALLYGVTE